LVGLAVGLVGLVGLAVGLVGLVGLAVGLVEFVGRAIGALVGASAVGTTAVDEPDVENRHTSRLISKNNSRKMSCRFNLKRIVALFSMYSGFRIQNGV
jgi:hypothetical protein